MLSADGPVRLLTGMLWRNAAMSAICSFDSGIADIAPRPFWTIGRDQLAVPIVEHRRRPKKVRTTAVAATRVGPVAERAVHAPQCLASFDGGGVSRWALRVRDEPAPTRTALLSGSGRDDVVPNSAAATNAAGMA